MHSAYELVMKMPMNESNHLGEAEISEIRHFLKRLQQDTGVEIPIDPALRTEVHKVDQLQNELLNIFGVKLESLIAVDSAFMKNWLIPKSFVRSDKRDHPAFLSALNCAQLIVSNFGNLVTVNPEQFVDEIVLRELVERIRSIGLVYLPENIALEDSNVPSITWRDRFFEYV